MGLFIGNDTSETINADNHPSTIDEIFAGGGDDTLNGLAGNDLLYGEEGNDTLNGGEDNDILNGGEGNDILNGGVGSDAFDDMFGIDQMYGGIGGDFFYIYSTDGDMIDGEDGSDRIYISLSQQAGPIDVDLRTLWAGGTVYFGTTSVRNVERLYENQILSQGDDRLIVGEDYLFGVEIRTGSGNDAVSAGGADDLLYGEFGNDELRGLDGNDRLYGGLGNDLLWGEEGDDRLDGGNDNDLLYGGEGSDNLWGGLGIDALDGGAGDDWLSITGGTKTLDGGADNDTFEIVEVATGSIEGGSGIDNLAFRLSTPVIRGMQVDLSNLWSGGTGTIGTMSVSGIEALSDANYGTTSNDRIVIGAGYAGAVHFDGWLGSDVISGGSGANRLFGGLGSDVLIGGGASDSLDGGREDDKLYGNGGDDILWGMQDNDILSGGEGRDTLHGASGADQLLSGNGDDLLFGGDGIDNLEGGAGNDNLGGGAGDDVILGGAGRDRLRGDGGADTFVFRLADFAGAPGPDVILDFNSAQGDLIDLREVDATNGAVLTFIGTAAFSNAAGELRAREVSTVYGTRTLLEADRDGDGDADVTIALQGSVALSSGDFIL